MSKPDLTLWPHLKIPKHPVLDGVGTEYTAGILTEMAEALSTSAPAIKAANGRGVWDTAIENVLRALADSPAALKVLNCRGNKPPVVQLNRAVHVRVLAELYPTRKAAADIWPEVGKLWGCTAGQIKDDVHEYSERERLPSGRLRYRDDDAKRLVATIVQNTCNARTRAGEPRSSRAAVLEDFDADLRHRARQLRAAK